MSGSAKRRALTYLFLLLFVDLSRCYQNWEGNLARKNARLSLRIVFDCEVPVAGPAVVRLDRLWTALVNDDYEVEVFDIVVVACRLELEACEAALTVHNLALRRARKTHLDKDGLLCSHESGSGRVACRVERLFAWGKLHSDDLGYQVVGQSRRHGLRGINLINLIKSPLRSSLVQLTENLTLMLGTFQDLCHRQPPVFLSTRKLRSQSSLRLVYNTC